MTKLSYKQFLIETPIGDYKLFGNWDKNSSFRHSRDRMLIQHPKSIERMKKKFSNSNTDFNLFFVNSPKANRLTEVGEVDLKFVRDKNIRNWFEILNELIAQYLTTGKIKFNKPPKSFGGRAIGNFHIYDDKYQDLIQHVDMLSRDMEYMIDDVLSSSLGKIFIM